MHEIHTLLIVCADKISESLIWIFKYNPLVVIPIYDKDYYPTIKYRLHCYEYFIINFNIRNVSFLQLFNFVS